MRNGFIVGGIAPITSHLLLDGGKALRLEIALRKFT
ncbi:Uncharacterised protein [Vibrio cholerae]|nr:Uncharacterised protein [Vibrio cholerae]